MMDGNLGLELQEGYWNRSGGAGMAAGEAHMVLLFAPHAGQAK